MSRSWFTWKTAALAALAVLGSTPAPAEAGPRGKRPNVIILLADDLGYADVGFHGCKDVPTPHIDSLAFVFAHALDYELLLRHERFNQVAVNPAGV